MTMRSAAGGDPSTGKAMAAMAATVSNFQAARTLANVTGWTGSTVYAPCRWSRVMCDQAGAVTSIDWSGWGLQGACCLGSTACQGHCLSVQQQDNLLLGGL